MNAQPKFDPPERDKFYRFLRMRSVKLSPNTEWLCRMLSSWSVGLGALPDYLGMEPTEFEDMQKAFFNSVPIGPQAPSGKAVDFSRMLERDDLVRYLFARAARPANQETAWITSILVAGCLGEDHLWQDLGLWSRQELTALIAFNFPQVAAANVKDMKWKKFLYKQLCESEGIYVCRSPTCEVCVDYARCYGSEE